MRKSLISSLLLILSYSSVTQAAKKELCFEAQSSASGQKTTMNLSFGEIRDGHLNLFGQGCYTITGRYECAPILGSAILHDNELETNLQSVDFEDYFGTEAMTESTFHMTLNLDSLAGTYAALASAWAVGQQVPIDVFDRGIVSAVSCPPVTKQEKALDQKFANAIKRINKK